MTLRNFPLDNTKFLVGDFGHLALGMTKLDEHIKFEFEGLKRSILSFLACAFVEFLVEHWLVWMEI